MSRPLVLARSARRPPWAERLADSVTQAPESLPAELEGFDSVWIDAAEIQPLQIARRVADADEAVQTVVVAPPEDMSLHERALLFTPGLGEIWLLGPDEVGPEALERARDVTGKRRRYQTRRGSMSRMVEQFDADRPRRAIVSDAYLAALLEVLPDPVISVDEAGRVVSWSAAAERCFGTDEAHALGRSVVDVLDPKDRAPLEEALERGRAGASRLELAVRGTGGRRIMETVIAPVETSGVEVRALVFRDVTRERESLEQLEREIELRSRSYAAMSHEIRTPINAIMGYNELLRMGAVGEDKWDDYLGRSQKAAAHLLSLVNDVLDLSKLESGGLEIQWETTRVDEIVQDLVHTLEPVAAERATPLEVDCEPSTGVIATDPKRLKQILINLVSNALKFGEGQPVHVRCRRVEERMEFEVEDRGQGIAPEQQERVFEEFVQVGDSGEGTGLGLPISRKLAELLGGDITVESELGSGSTFRLVLPVEPDPAPDPSAGGSPDGQDGSGRAASGPPASQRPAPGRRAAERSDLERPSTRQREAPPRTRG